MNIFTENLAHIKEMKIRGVYMMIASDIEFILLSIINYSSPNPINHERAGKFKAMKFSQKINNTRRDLKDHKPHYYEQFEGALNGLDELINVRNDMAHCVGSFPNEPDLSIFKIHYVDKDENGIEGMKFKEYTDEYIEMSCERFSRITLELTMLMQTLHADCNSKDNPLIHPEYRNK